MSRLRPPPEVREDPKGFKFIDGAWMRLIDVGEYVQSVGTVKRPVHGGKA